MSLVLTTTLSSWNPFNGLPLGLDSCHWFLVDLLVHDLEEAFRLHPLLKDQKKHTSTNLYIAILPSTSRNCEDSCSKISWVPFHKWDSNLAFITLLSHKLIYSLNSNGYKRLLLGKNGPMSPHMTRGSSMLPTCIGSRISKLSDFLSILSPNLAKPSLDGCQPTYLKNLEKNKGHWYQIHHPCTKMYKLTEKWYLLNILQPSLPLIRYNNFRNLTNRYPASERHFLILPYPKKIQKACWQQKA
jgi:hypothetical protein